MTVEDVLKEYLEGNLQEGDVAVAVMEEILLQPTCENMDKILEGLPAALRPAVVSYLVDINEQEVDPHEVLCLGVGDGGRNTTVEEGRVLLNFSRDHREFLRGYMPKYKTRV